MKKQFIKHTTTLLFIFLSLSLGLQISFASNKNPQQSLDRIVVIVNEGIITESELEQSLKTIKQELAASNTPLPSENQLRKQVLDQLINRKLQLELAEQMGIKVTDANLNKAIKQIADGNKLSVKELYERVGMQGVPVDKYRKEIKEELMLRLIQQQEVGPKIVISPHELDDFIRSKAWQTSSTKEYHLENIVIPLPENPTPQMISEAKQKANAILIKLRKEASFKNFTANENNALEVNDLGFRKASEIPTAFLNEVLKMKVNDVSDLIQTPNGFHIIHLIAIKDIDPSASVVPSKKQMEQLLFQRKFQEAVKNWIIKLRSEAVINMNP